MNINENDMNNIKNLVDNGNISEAISHISPEMIQNFSKMFAQQNNSNTTDNTNTASSNNNNADINNTKTGNNSVNSSNSTNANNTSYTGNSSGIPNIDLSGIDMNTIMKMSSAFGKMNNSNDPRANLLNSLKPYLRDDKKGKLDNYMNLLNVTKIAEIMKNNDKENKNNV